MRDGGWFFNGRVLLSFLNLVSDHGLAVYLRSQAFGVKPFRIADHPEAKSSLCLVGMKISAVRSSWVDHGIDLGDRVCRKATEF